MATLDITGLQAVEFSVDTVVTLPGGAFTAKAGAPYQTRVGETSLTVNLTTPVLCMLVGKNNLYNGRGGGPVMRMDLVRTPV